ncbi:MAG: response regulator transcription factor [Phycisphaerae bacterium]|nr:response regulator transcription factor [Phycisphaerae bacterium]
MTSGTERQPVRVFVIDDHPLLIEGIRGIITQEDDMEFLGGETSVRKGLQAVRETHPNVCIVDLHLPDGNGIELVEEIRKRSPEIRVLVLSMCKDRIYAERALRAGASGYLEKVFAPMKLIEAIRECHAGRIYLSREITGVLLARLNPGNDARASGVESLSEREFQIFECLGRGLTNPEIAEECCLSIRTVETYYSRIKEKLHLGNTTQLRQFAIRWSRENCAV